MEELAAQAGLFAASFLAATVRPFQSDLVLVGRVAGGEFPWCALLAVAFVGNTLDSLVNWLLGRFVLRFEDRRWFPVKPDAHTRGRSGLRTMACGPCCSPGYLLSAIR